MATTCIQHSSDIFDHLNCRECDCPCHEPRTLFQSKIKFRKERTRVFLSTPEKPYTTVYRVEDDEGYGPFRVRPDNNDTGSPFRRGPWSVLWKRKSASCIMTIGPDDVFDDETLVRFRFFNNWRNYKVGEKWYHNYFNSFLYGCEDAAQLKMWFSRRDLKVMRKFGFRVRAKKAWLVLYSPVQCAYIPYEEGMKPAFNYSPEVHT